jgi:hypothetical protein
MVVPSSHGVVLVSVTVFDRMLLTVGRSLIFLKVILGIQLVLFATRRSQRMKEREVLDSMNDYGRPPVGESIDERVRPPPPHCGLC